LYTAGIIIELKMFSDNEDFLITCSLANCYPASWNCVTKSEIHIITL